MHCSQRVKTGGHVVQHDSGAFRKRLQLSHWRRLDDIEGTKKYKARQKRFPRQRHGDQCHQLTGYLINHHKLRIFCPGAARDPRSRRNRDQRDQYSHGDCHRGARRRRKYVGQRRPQQHARRRSPSPRPGVQPSDAEKCGYKRSPKRCSAGRSRTLSCACRRDSPRHAGATVGFRACDLGSVFHDSSSASSGVCSRIGSSASATGDGIT